MHRFRRLAAASRWSGKAARGLRVPIVWQFVMSPLGGLAALVVVAGTCGLVIERFVLILAAIALVVLLLGIVWPRVMVWGMRASFQFSQERSCEGQPVKATLALSNLWPVPVWGLVVEGLSDFSPQAPVALPTARPWSKAIYTWPFEAGCRGVYPGSSLTLATSFPFGLVTGRRRIPCATPLLVAPRALPVEFALPTGGDLPADRGSRLRASGGSGDLLGVRPYRMGDSLRRVHWAQTAKHEQLVVCEREASVQPAAELVVDLRPETHAGTAPNGSLEWCLRIAVSICQSILTTGGRVCCRLGDRTFNLDGRRSEWRAFVDYLAEIPRQGLPHREAKSSQRQAPRSRIVIASDASDLSGLGVPARELIAIVLRRSAFGGALQIDRERHPAPIASHCVVLDAPERVASQLAIGLKREISPC